MSAFAPQGPDCSSSSQVVAVAAVALSGSVSSRDSVVQVLTRPTLRPDGPRGYGRVPTEGRWGPAMLGPVAGS
ncbi:hypothetical protein Kpho02_54390 [Kitasatospora phosalacinea]|uniref:Uncharacterized protein n=1 Tax=Kitasatospora phosalacinea TaxID=2065 RepID=A0A9W6QA04_9ACTN|nr:hypothetical protein Kpho02_54390 [Kitasatospora phosalacinea]